MFQSLYPREFVDSAYGIPYEKFYQRGIRAVLFDVDNTLVPHGAPADDRARALFERLRGLGMGACLISNNKEPRVASFARAVGASYIYKAGKPRPGGYEKAMRILNSDRAHTIFVGDQLFTDVWGANRAGIYTILVKPIHPREEIQIVLKRRLEAVVLYFYRRELKKKKQCREEGKSER